MHVLWFRRSAIAIVALCAAMAANANEFRAQSPDLGLTFRTLKKDKWCAPEVSIVIDAERTDAFAPNHVEFQQAIGRLRGALLSECKLVERITLEARRSGSIVYRGESSRVARWRVIAHDTSTGRPRCPQVGSDDRKCASRVEAFLVAVRNLKGSVFGRTEMTRMLTGGAEDEDLEFRTGSIVATVRMMDRSSMPGISERSTTFADALESVLGDQCRADGGKLERRPPREVRDTVSTRGFVCSNGSKVQTTAIVAQGRGSSLAVFVIGDLTKRSPEAFAQAEALGERLSRDVPGS